MSSVIFDEVIPKSSILLHLWRISPLFYSLLLSFYEKKLAFSLFKHHSCASIRGISQDRLAKLALAELFFSAHQNLEEKMQNFITETIPK